MSVGARLPRYDLGHYWARVVQCRGHEVKIIPAKAVTPFRQGKKTDPNDALAVAEAASWPNVKLAPLKSIQQQALRSIQRSRELLVQNRTPLSNHVRGLLMEFGIVIPQGWSALHCEIPEIPEILEDGENELPDLYRSTLHVLWQRLCELRDDIKALHTRIEGLVKQDALCHRLLTIEGVGPMRNFEASSPTTHRVSGVRIHCWPGDSVYMERPNMRARLISSTGMSLMGGVHIQCCRLASR